MKRVCTCSLPDHSLSDIERLKGLGALTDFCNLGLLCILTQQVPNIHRGGQELSDNNGGNHQVASPRIHGFKKLSARQSKFRVKHAAEN